MWGGVMDPNLEWERFVFNKGNARIEVIREKVFEDDFDNDDLLDYDMFN